MRDLYMDDFTMESIAKTLSRYPDNGLLVYVDELKGFFESMDSYRKGGDRQKWLSINNGGSIKVNRSGANTIYIHQSSIGIVGGIQPRATVTPYESLSKVYMDIETTGLNPKIDRVLMVGLLLDGVTTIITDPDERTLLDKTIAYLNRHKPDCLIGHNLFNFDSLDLLRK